jgi:hypothetical protein
MLSQYLLFPIFLFLHALGLKSKPRAETYPEGLHVFPLSNEHVSFIERTHSQEQTQIPCWKQ